MVDPSMGRAYRRLKERGREKRETKNLMKDAVREAGREATNDALRELIGADVGHPSDEWCGEKDCPACQGYSQPPEGGSR